MVSSYTRSCLSLLAANSSGCLFGKATQSLRLSGACLNRSPLRAMTRQVPCCHCSAVSLERRAATCIYAAGASPDWCSPVSSLLPLQMVTRKVNCSRRKLRRTSLRPSACCRAVQTTYAVSAPLPLSFRTFTYARTVARASIDLGVQGRETCVADKLRTNDRQCYFIDILACQPGVARAFALRAELRRFAPPAGSPQLYRFAITQARDELSERLLFHMHCSSGVARAFALRATCTNTLLFFPLVLALKKAS